MKLREASAIILTIVLVCACIVGYVSSRHLGMEDDGVIEEICESIAEDQLGLPEGSIDFTPESPEGLQEKLLDRYLKKNA